MSNSDKHRNFLKYINNPMSIESIMVIYAANNIKFEKCELYGDFVQSLLRLVFDTYLGDEVSGLEDQVSHFNWCWNKNIENFLQEGITFKNYNLFEYFSEYMFEVFYTSEKPYGYTDKTSLKLWGDIFDYSRLKTNSEMDTFVEIYKIFEKSLKLV